MAISFKWENAWLPVLAISFALVYSWIEYFVLNAVLLTDIFSSRIIFLLGCLVIAYAFGTIDPYAGAASFISGAFVEDYVYRYFAHTAYLDKRLMVGVAALAATLFILSVVKLSKNDKQKFKITEPPKEETKLEIVTNFVAPPEKVIQKEAIIVESNVVKEVESPKVEVGEEEKFDPEKEERKKRVKDRYLEKMKKKYNGR